MSRKSLNIAIAAALLGSIALVGCKKKTEEAVVTPPAASEPVAPVEEAPMATPAATSVTGISLGSAIGADSSVANPSNAFAPGDTIYVSIATNTYDPTATVPSKLGAKWTFQDGQVINEETRDVNLSGNGMTEFHISKPDGWPAGNYKVEVSLDGMPVQSADFSVK